MSGQAAKALRARPVAAAEPPPAPSSVTPLKPANRMRRRVRRGETLFGAGDPFGTLFVVRAGHFKSLASSANGQVQVTGFPMAADVLGLDGIDTGFHQCDVVAFDNAEVFVLPFAECEQWARETAHGQRTLRRALARLRAAMITCSCFRPRVPTSASRYSCSTWRSATAAWVNRDPASRCA
jgi:hypothetical protein